MMNSSKWLNVIIRIERWKNTFETAKWPMKSFKGVARTMAW
jgi:hypothetical protein